MKRNIIHTLWMAAALPLCAVLASCEQEDFPGMAETSGIQTLSISVTDGGYAADGKSGSTSRAVENGYSTVFTAGDKCGLYIVRGGNVVNSNVCLTAKEDSDGSLVWAPDEGVTLSGGSDGDRCFLYYPYKEGNHEVDASKTDDTGFFESLISGWEVKSDQSSYADYTASDLMTATTTLSNNERSLTFNMTHRMALSVIEVPRTVYHFTNGNGTIPDYVIKTTDFSGSGLKPCCMSDGSYRYIASPGTTSKISGSYLNKSKDFAVTPNTTPGAFKKYIVDGGKVDTKQHNLQIGDYLLADGSLISKESLTDELKQNVRAVVFWFPAETDYTDTNRESPARLTDDKIMNKEHPDCVHGLAVALGEVASCCWMEGGNDTYYSVWWNFQKDHSFYSPSYSDYASVLLELKEYKILGNKVLGYNNTKVIRSYNALSNLTGRHMCVKAVDELDKWEKDNPAPDNTTGWYMPSIKELSMLCSGDIDVVLIDSYNKNVCIAVNNSLNNIGNKINTNRHYWSSTEAPEGDNTKYAFNVYFYNGRVSQSIKSENFLKNVRAVCAF